MRLIIDTDTAGDDVFSILLALRHPGVRVEAITICHGNVGFGQHVENALVTLDAAGAGETPVYPGCDRPLARPPLRASYVFGADGMSDARFPPSSRKPQARHAVDAMIATVLAAPGEIDILAQAPLTNIAAAVQQAPGFAAAVRTLWVMGGTDGGRGNVTPAAEYNFYADPEAAKIVFAAGFDLHLVTWTLAWRDSLIRAAELDSIARLETPLARFFTQVNAASRRFAMERQGLAGSLHPDALACALAIAPALALESERCFVDVETAGALTRGYCSVSSPLLPEAREADPALPPSRPANARVIRHADRDGFLALLRRTLSDS